GWSWMSESRWQALVAGAAVVVGAATSVVTNVVTDGWPAVFVVVLVALVVVGVVLAVLPFRRAPAVDSPGRGGPRLRPRATARGQGVGGQAGRDVTLAPPEARFDVGPDQPGPSRSPA